MGLLDLMRAMSIQRQWHQERRRRQAQASPDGLIIISPDNDDPCTWNVRLETMRLLVLMRAMSIQLQWHKERRRRQAQASPDGLTVTSPDKDDSCTWNVRLEKMRLLVLMRAMSIRQERQAQAPPDGLIATSPANGRKGSLCLPDNDDLQGGEIDMYSKPSLPEDVWCHIHSLMPMWDAARTACVSRAFLRSWRCHPNLVFDIKTLGLDKIASGHNKIARVFSSKVDQILKKHIGIGVKRLKIELKDYNEKDSPHLDRWLQIAVTPGIEELTLSLPIKSQYNFPHSLLCNGSGDTIQSFHLICCSFSPTAELGLLRSLTRLHLQYVCITGHKLEHFLSDSFALEHLKITFCDEIVRLKVPYVLQRLSYLHVGSCQRLQMIDIEAPNISNLYISLEFKAQLSIGEKLQVKDLNLSFSGAVHYACVELPPRVPNLETLSICSWREVANTPMLHSKFPHLRMLMIGLSGTRLCPTYDYFSLVSFLHSCPSLEAFVLDVSQKKRKHVSILTDDSDLRQIQEYGHHKLKMKRVEILGFSSAKSLVELTGHIVESAMSLECITLDASQCFMKCWSPNNKSGKCFPVSTDQLMEARRALLAIRTYVQPKVPSTVKLNVVEPCSRCYDVNQCLEYPVFGSS